MQSEMVGKAQTVLGPVDPDSLGITLPHEHFLFDGTFNFIKPDEADEKILAYQPVNLENLNWVIYHAFNSLDNYRWDNEQLIVKELMPFKRAGGNTIVEQSVRGLAGNPLAAERISQATDINVILATGYYFATTHPPTLTATTEEEIANDLIRDIMVGIGDTVVRAGILKAACGGTFSLKIEDTERKVMRACALAQRRTGAAIGIHNMREDFAAEVMEILSDSGADLSRTIMMHADRWGSDPSVFPKLLQAGCYLEFDGFGTDERGLVPRPPYQAYHINDTQRCDIIVRLIAQGYLEHILVSQDIFVKTRHTSFGGVGYAHILENVLPLMRHKGISDEQIHTIMVKNLKRILTLFPAKE